MVLFPAFAMVLPRMLYGARLMLSTPPAMNNYITTLNSSVCLANGFEAAGTEPTQ